MLQKGGVITMGDSAQAFHLFFTLNAGSKIKYLTHGLEGIIFVCESNNSNYYGFRPGLLTANITRVLIKLSFIHTIKSRVDFVANMREMQTMTREGFMEETELQLKVVDATIEHFEPVSPTILFRHILPIGFIWHLLDLNPDEHTREIIKSFTIPAGAEVGINVMEYADPEQNYMNMLTYIEGNNDTNFLYQTRAVACFELFRLAYSGINQGDYHHKNILITNDYPNYFLGKDDDYYWYLNKRALVIDYGRGNVFDEEILEEFRLNYTEMCKTEPTHLILVINVFLKQFGLAVDGVNNFMRECLSYISDGLEEYADDKDENTKTLVGIIISKLGRSVTDLEFYEKTGKFNVYVEFDTEQFDTHQVNNPEIMKTIKWILLKLIQLYGGQVYDENVRFVSVRINTNRLIYYQSCIDIIIMNGERSNRQPVKNPAFDWFTWNAYRTEEMLTYVVELDVARKRGIQETILQTEYFVKETIGGWEGFEELAEQYDTTKHVNKELITFLIRHLETFSTRETDGGGSKKKRGGNNKLLTLIKTIGLKKLSKMSCFAIVFILYSFGKSRELSKAFDSLSYGLLPPVVNNFVNNPDIPNVLQREEVLAFGGKKTYKNRKRKRKTRRRKIKKKIF